MHTAWFVRRMPPKLKITRFQLHWLSRTIRFDFFETLDCLNFDFDLMGCSAKLFSDWWVLDYGFWTSQLRPNWCTNRFWEWFRLSGASLQLEFLSGLGRLRLQFECRCLEKICCSSIWSSDCCLGLCRSTFSLGFRAQIISVLRSYLEECAFSFWDLTQQVYFVLHSVCCKPNILYQALLM